MESGHPLAPQREKTQSTTVKAEPENSLRAPTVEDNLRVIVLPWLRVSPQKVWSILETWRWTFGIQTPRGLYDLLRQSLGLDEILARICVEYACSGGPPPWVAVDWALAVMPPERQYRQVQSWRAMGVPV